MVGSAMVTMATKLFCLNKLLENLPYFDVVYLSVDLRVKRFDSTRYLFKMLFKFCVKWKCRDGLQVD
jgi:hypothetical protein